jgi:endonuclease-3
LLDVLIQTILSQNTSDVNSLRAYAGLRKAFPSWSALAEVDVGKVAVAIRPGGLANIKSRRIVQILRDLKKAYGRPTLEHLRRMKPEAAYAALKDMAGVGPKTAACTLLFGAGIPIFPVDTHIHRVCRRLGWAGPRETREKFQERIRRLVPGKKVYPLHLNLIEHGRRVCRAGKPACPTCCLKTICPFGKVKK